MKTGKLDPSIGCLPIPRLHSPRLPLLSLLLSNSLATSFHVVLIAPPLYCSQLLVFIMCSGSPPGDLCDPGLSSTQQLSGRRQSLAEWSRAWTLLLPYELSQLMTSSNFLVWSKHLVRDSYTMLMFIFLSQAYFTFLL